MKKKRTEVAVAEVEFFLQENSTYSLTKKWTEDFAVKNYNVENNQT